MPVTAAHLCAEARRWERVRYAHLQSTRDGCDCVGLLVGVAKAVGLLPPDFVRTPFPIDWHLHQGNEHFRDGIEALGGVAVPVTQLAPGMIALFRFGQVSSHAGIVLPGPELLHASVLARRVVRHGWKTAQQAHLAAAYTFPGVVYPAVEVPHAG
jgi:cell wall-associated NlpC family hydrolase